MKLNILLFASLACLLCGVYATDWGLCWLFQYNDGGGCNCGCGGHYSTPLYDPDCGPFGTDPPLQPYPQSITCQPLTWNRNLWCTENGTCAPCIGCNVWTCFEWQYRDSICHCNCGMNDPACNVDHVGAANCASDEVCDATGACNRCGNGVVDNGETCDRKGGCCSSDCSTKLQDGIDCNGGSGSCNNGVCIVPADIDTATTSHISAIKARLTWNLKPGPYETFKIQRRKQIGPNQWTSWYTVYNDLSNWSVDGNGDFYKQIPNLDPETTYMARIRNKIGGKSSDWKETASFTTDPA